MVSLGSGPASHQSTFYRTLWVGTSAMRPPPLFVSHSFSRTLHIRVRTRGAVFLSVHKPCRANKLDAIRREVFPPLTPG